MRSFRGKTPECQGTFIAGGTELAGGGDRFARIAPVIETLPVWEPPPVGSGGPDESTRTPLVLRDLRPVRLLRADLRVDLDPLPEALPGARGLRPDPGARHLHGRNGGRVGTCRTPIGKDAKPPRRLRGGRRRGGTGRPPVSPDLRARRGGLLRYGVAPARQPRRRGSLQVGTRRTPNPPAVAAPRGDLPAHDRRRHPPVPPGAGPLGYRCSTSRTASARPPACWPAGS